MALIVDERRYDISAKYAIARGEYRSIRYTVREKVGGVWTNVSTFTPFTEWEFYCLDRLGTDKTLTQVGRQTASIFYVAVGAMTLSVPYVTVPMTELQTAMPSVGTRAHELWVKINGNWSRVSFGDLPFVD